MSVGHYENFPVASVALPARLRRPVVAIYRFARTADDFADEGELPPAARLAALDAMRRELDLLQAGGAGLGEAALYPANLFPELAAAIHTYKLPFALFYDLLDAFSQDVTTTRYDNYAQLLEYCRRSANPIGRLMLHLYAATTPQNFADSDRICSALQLINFWQDVAIDYKKDRIYIPGEDLRRFNIDESQIAQANTSGGWPDLMQFEITRAAGLLDAGAELAVRLHGRVGLELRLMVQGGRRIAEKLARLEGDVFRRRPVLTAMDWPLIIWRALTMRAHGA